jgi:PKHD-type hydroxylase
MLITIAQVLSADEVRHWRERLDAANWDDGASTAGTLSRSVKRNQQLPDDAEPGASLSRALQQRLMATPLFVSAALPLRLHPPRFNRYADGGTYGTHVDGALMRLPDGRMLRSDLSATLFLTDPADYDGGELEIESRFGAQTVKLAAGDLVLYPSSSLHRVMPVTRGARTAAIVWLQSTVRDDDARERLFDLDQTIQSLTPDLGTNDPRLVSLTGVYHNLLRRWADT